MSASLRTFRMFRTESHLGGVLKQDEERRLLVDDARPALFKKREREREKKQ